MSKARKVIFVLLISIVNLPGFAATTTGNLPVNATVAAACIFGNITSVNFGNYTGAQNDATGAIEVNCTNGTTYTVSLGAGTGSGATVAARLMTRTPTPGTLAYNLYTTNARTTIWGDGTSGTVVMPQPPPATGTGAIQSYTVYGRIAAGLTPTAGSYNDTV